MKALLTFQRDFVQALTARDPAARPEGLTGKAGERFRIYRNTYFAGIGGRLAEVFPATKAILGEMEFKAAGLGFAAAHPPKTRTLACFGKGFPEFLSGHKPMPWISDLARLELACHEATNAADADALDPKKLVALGEGILKARFEIHPAALVLRLDYPVLGVWKAALEGKKVKAGQIRKDPYHILITRPGERVKTAPLGAPEAAFFEALKSGRPAVSAARAAEKAGTGFDPKAAFGKFLAAGAFQGFSSR